VDLQPHNLITATRRTTETEKKKMKSKLSMLLTTLALTILLITIALPVVAVPPTPPSPTPLDPTTIPKYVNQLDGPPPVYVPRVIRGKGGELVRHEYTVLMQSFEQQILPTQYANGTATGFGPTPVWGYGGIAKDAITGMPVGFVRNSPGPTFEATRGIPVHVNWQNRIWSSHMFAVDPTLHWANPNNFPMPEYPVEAPPFPPGYPEAQWPVPLIPHLHGGEVQSTSDGHPEAWFTINGIQGPAYNTARLAKGGNTAVFVYPNEQPPTTLWYHDHALGITRLNVMSGLAGFYLLRDFEDGIAPLLPSGKYEMPIVIQDRIFNNDSTMYFYTEGNSPDDHPYWQPEFFGDTIMVNGKVWPNMNVDQGQYRFRLLDGSNARFYNLSFQVGSLPDALGNPTVWGDVIPFIQIGSDGGYLNSSAPLNNLIIAPGERADILVYFNGTITPPGTTVILRNDAYAPFKGGSKEGDPPGPVEQIMQFTVTDNLGFEPQELPDKLNDLFTGDWPTLPDEIGEERILPLVEVMSGVGDPIMILLNGQKWAADISEMPVLGSTEEWVIVNPTEDTHPIHLHLVQFQLVYRQALNDSGEYFDAWVALQGVDGPPWPDDHMVEELDYEDWLDGSPIWPTDNEKGWKDTIQANPGEITVIRVRFAPIDGSTNYPFDATEGPGYVWHCHILDHEDNEMMRPFVVLPEEDDE